MAHVRLPEELKGYTGLITIEEAAAFILWCPSKLYTEAKAGRIPSYKIGKNRRFKIAEIERWIEDRRANTVKEAA